MKPLSETPQTDAAHDATLNSDYEYDGAEDEAWEFARELERELNELKCSTSNNWHEATDNWVELTLKKYEGFEPNDLTQVFMRGPFAGWSERMVYELAENMDKANKQVPRHNV